MQQRSRNISKSKMKKTLILSFDLVRSGEPSVSLAVGSLLSFLHQQERYGNDFTVDHISFNLYNDIAINSLVETITKKHNLTDLHFIAISCYVWSDYLTKDLISALRRNGFNGNIILGGYQIAYRENIASHYPDAQIFILGYGEESLYEAISQTQITSPLYLQSTPNLELLKSPYILNEIPVEVGQKSIRLETKRGCIYKCFFCAHRDLHGDAVLYHTEDKIYDELMLMKQKQVKKINIVDPLFTVGNNYFKIIEKILDIGLNAEITLQARFELLRGRDGDRLVELLRRANFHLEFGLQSVHKKELALLGRRNDMSAVQDIMQKLSHANISYEVSLIFGIPYQTIASFKESIDFVKANGCTNIKAFPLEILKGTPLWFEREKLRRKENLREMMQGKNRIPYVVSCNSFTKDDWYEMKDIADSLKREADLPGKKNVKN